MTDVHNEDEHGPILTVTEARGARRGRHMAWVLGVSLALIVAAFTALWLSSASGLSGAGGQQTADSKAAATGFNTPPLPPRKTDSGSLSRPGVG